MLHGHVAIGPDFGVYHRRRSRGRWTDSAHIEWHTIRRRLAFWADWAPILLLGTTAAAAGAIRIVQVTHP